MKKIYIIGAGQLGSRHLQALRAVKIPLDITVIDPFKESLSVAKQRYEDMNGENHRIRYIDKIDRGQKIDLAIIATNSDVRAEIIKKLLKNNQVKYLILEKLLFTQKRDYSIIAKLIKKTNTKTWVDCSMRTMPYYFNLKKRVPQRFVYFVNGSQYGLATNAIHYIDHMAYLSDCLNFIVDTTALHGKILESKRKGFLELTGSIKVHFENGSKGIFVCYPDGDAPVQVEIHSSGFRTINRQIEGKAWTTGPKEKWLYREEEAKVPYQSEMTTDLVRDILTKGTCYLPDYETSKKIHIQLLEPLRKFVNCHSRKKYTYYPFT